MSSQVTAVVDGGWVELPPDSTGKRVKHFILTEVQSDGTTQSVFIPSFSLIDPNDETPANVVFGNLRTEDVYMRQLLEQVLAALVVLVAKTDGINNDSAWEEISKMEGVSNNISDV